MFVVFFSSFDDAVFNKQGTYIDLTIFVTAGSVHVVVDEKTFKVGIWRDEGVITARDSAQSYYSPLV